MLRIHFAFALGFLLAVQASAQFSAGQTVEVATYHNQLTLEGAGSYQRILYEDAVNSTMTTNMLWSEVYVAPCGKHTPGDLLLFYTLCLVQSACFPNPRCVPCHKPVTSLLTSSCRRNPFGHCLNHWCLFL